MSRSTRTWLRVALPALLVIASIAGGLGPVPGASGQVIATATPAVTVSAVASVSPVATAPVMADVPGTSTPAAVGATTPVMAVATVTQVATVVASPPTSVATTLVTPDAVATGSVVPGTATVMVTGTSVAGTVTPVVPPVATAGAGVPPAGAARPPGMPGNPWGGMVPGLPGRGSAVGGVAPTPKPVTAVTGSVRSRDAMSGAFTSLAAGHGHTCGLTSGGTAYCWGYNDQGQLGDGTTELISTIPVAVSGGKTFTSLVAGEAHTCGLASVGTAYCWGRNGSGQLGDGTRDYWGSTSDRTVPVAVTGGLIFETIQASGWHTCAITKEIFSAYCWGSNGYGQIGDGAGGSSGNTDDRVSPVRVSTYLQFKTMALGGNREGFTCGLTVDLKSYCWGYNAEGQLGDGTTAQRLSPVAVDV